MKSSPQGATFVDCLRDRTQAHPRQTAFTFLKTGDTPARVVTYEALDHRARAIAAHLQSMCCQGDRVVLIYPYDAGIEFIEAFLGCLYAGIIAVPCHPPRSRSGLSDLIGRLLSSEATAVLTPKSMQAKLKHQLAQSDAELPVEIMWLLDAKMADHPAKDWQPPLLTPDMLAFLQYTSGSTGLPKGVMITHAGLLHNQALLQLAFGHTETLMGMGWLPLFHDMGLIGNVLQPLYLGSSCVLMSPIEFIQKPVRWLQAISHYRATTSGGPNFAYDLLCRHVTPEQIQSLDLSPWEVAFSGAEPVRPDTMKRFAAMFAPAGFRPEAFYPCYGMAEATLFIAGGQKAKRPQILQVDESALENNRVLRADRLGQRGRSLVSCGHAWLDGQLVIVHPERLTRCADDEVGEIWVAGSGLGTGYWHDADLSDRTFCAYLSDTREGPFLRTGDLGFLHNHELFITGRLHDVMVFWGLNHYPQHIEQTVAECHPAFRAHSCAAFSINVQQHDRLVIAQEVKRSDRHHIRAADVADVIRWKIFHEHFIDAYAIALVNPGGLPQTSSGKIKRSACRSSYIAGDLDVLDEWRSPADAPADLSVLMRYYLNPFTHLRRYANLARGYVQQWSTRRTR